MSKNQRTRYHVRKRMFLNRDPDMRAFAIAIVEDTRHIVNDNEKDFYWGEMQLNLGDCQRHVAFDFDLSSSESRRNSLYKIRKIAEIVNAFREALEIEAQSIQERQNKQEPKVKAKAKSASG